ncbi:MAG: DUF814 domain-containing protein, partial [Armatimonadetes bacterium]|nr:DUF814 domain-containing protein [Armatimonadota bacterium]
VRFDRILRLEFRRGEERNSLLLELMGRHSNLILIEEKGRILGAIKTVPPAQTRVRPIVPGGTYEDPPGVRPDPRCLAPEELAQALAGASEPDAITRALSGWGTFAAREALADGDVAAAVAERMARVREGRFEPCVLLGPGERPAGVWAFPSRQPGWTARWSYPTLSAACEEFYEYQQTHAATEELRRSVVGELNRALRTVRVQLAEATASWEGLEETEQLRIWGELLAAQGAGVPRGSRSASVPNWYDPELRPAEIPLDPELDVRENAALYFHRYRRRTAAAEAALERIPTLEERTATLEQLLAQAARADHAELEGMARHELIRRPEPVARGERAPAAARERLPAGVRLKRVTVQGWEICYGENATSNDYLTTRVARPDDLWLHARAISGAHVVIRGVGSLDRLPPPVLREAARLAAAHSDAKHTALVSVDYTFRRYVRKPRGSAPGHVLYQQEKTIQVEQG